MSINFQTPQKWQGGSKRNLRTGEIIALSGGVDITGETIDYLKNSDMRISESLTDYLERQNLNDWRETGDYYK